MNKKRHITILGGGIAGLATAYFAKKRGFDVSVFEANRTAGGLCRTIRAGEYLFDTGAHRIHDRDEEMTRAITEIPGLRTHRVDAPSQIFSRGQFVDFPIRPFNLARVLGLSGISRTGCEIAANLLSPSPDGPDETLESFSIRRYGRSVAERFILNYSKKLWGVSCRRLSVTVSGKRLNGLSLGGFIRELLFGSRTGVKHVEGAFFYPKRGIGEIADNLVESIGPSNVKTNSTVTSIHHENGKIRSVMINNDRKYETDFVVSTLPLSTTVKHLTPAAPGHLIDQTGELRFRSIILVALFMDIPKLTGNATLYFPDPDIIFTRVVEPNNRSNEMAPPGKTSLVAEIPCQENDELWNSPDDLLLERVIEALSCLPGFRKTDIIESMVGKLPTAYPVIEIGTKKAVSELMSYLHGFDNLLLTGRHGLFQYTWMHDQFRTALGTVSRLSELS